MRRRDVLIYGLSTAVGWRGATAERRQGNHGVGANVSDFIPPALRTAALSGGVPAQEYLQLAVSSGARMVTVPPNARLRLEPAGTKSAGKMRIPFCVALPSNVELDLNGATLFIPPEQRAAVLVNDGIGAVENTDIVVRDGVLDGGSPSESAPVPAELETGCLTFHGVRRAELRGITVTGARQYAGRFLKCADSRFYDLVCLSSNGDGWSFGISPYDQTVVSSTIDRVTAKNCQGHYPGLVGNGIIFTVRHCRVGVASTLRCSGGIKIQDSSRDSSFEQLIFEGGDNGTANSGIKVQGNTAAGLFPTGIRLNRVRSINCAGEGLAIRFAGKVEIASYVGRKNSSVLKNRDIDLRGDDVRVNEISIYESAGEGLSISGAGRYLLGNVAINEALGFGLHIAAPCRCDIDVLTVKDCGGGISVTHPQAQGHISTAVVESRESGGTMQSLKSVARDFHVCGFRDNDVERTDPAC